MRIGLVRHFEVECPHKWFLSSKEFRKWVEEYDCSQIKITKTTANEFLWDKCYCSDLSRAIETARHIYKGSIVESSLIREVPIMPVVSSNIKLPYFIWLLAGRMAWYFSHSSQPETIKQTKERVERFVSKILKESAPNVLVVTHGLFMLQLRKELNYRGFFNDAFLNAKNGRIYLFENDKY